MNEVRQDPTSGTVTIYAPERSCRPRELPVPSGDRSPELEEKLGLAVLLHDMARRLGNSLDDPDYNIMLVSRANRSESTNGGHWYLSIRPRLITLGGFEIGAGVNINPSLPEQDARRLRSAR